MRHQARLTGSELIAELLPLETALRKRGIARLDLFGSRARGDCDDDSDVDILIELAPDSGFTLLDWIRLERWLTRKIGIAAHVETWTSVPRHAYDAIKKEAVPVF